MEAGCEKAFAKCRLKPSSESVKMDGKQTRFNGSLKKIALGIVDVALFAFANCSICYLTMNGHIMATEYSGIIFNYLHFGLTSLILIGINALFGLYRSVWYFAGSDEIVKSFVAALLHSVTLFFVDRLLFRDLLHNPGYLPYYAYILFFVLMIVATLLPRIGYRILRRYLRNIGTDPDKRNKKRVMIVGAGFMGNFIIDELRNGHYAAGRPVVAVDDNPAKYRKRINGVKIAGKCDDIPRLTEKYNVDEIIICIPSATMQRQRELIRLSMQTAANVKISPSVQEFLESGGTARKIRNVEIADLLSRPEIKLDRKVCRYLVGKSVLVTGGGGSIGSEICMQVARYNPEKIIIFDIYENCAFELYNTLLEKYKNEIDIYVRIGSVRDLNRLQQVFEEFHPDVVFHAAAHKHVPLMEDSPCEAVKNNVFGTYNVAITADAFQVPKMVILSTDKAVNPTNVMGATKRITEVIVQYMNKKSKNTQYAAVRFGNVLGSHGSVIPIFQHQIENGGPVCVTHPDITRYFMTIPEAAQLVCQAGGLAKGGEVFVLDMGEPVKIMDLAKNLIRLSGFTEEEIPIQITGLRPGEKLYEELAMEEELQTRQKTANEKIYVTQPMDFDDNAFESMLQDLKNITNENVRDKLMKIIPNYHPAEINTKKE